MSDEQNNPWAAYASDPQNEDYVVGNLEGLTKLRDAIDEAIKKGISSIDENNIDVRGVQLKERPKNEKTKNTLANKAIGTGCVLVILVCIAIFIFGITQLPELIK